MMDFNDMQMRHQTKREYTKARFNKGITHEDVYEQNLKLSRETLSGLKVGGLAIYRSGFPLMRIKSIGDKIVAVDVKTGVGYSFHGINSASPGIFVSDSVLVKSCLRAYYPKKTSQRA
jgi:hypothetical protein